MIRHRLLDFLFLIIFWVPVILFSVLLTHNAMLYFTHGGEYGILPEKIAAREDLLWNVAFYIHLPTGVVCLLSPIILFARRYLTRFGNLHQQIGRVYVWITLIFVFPTGMYLALYAKGGLVTQIGFMIQGILLASFTYQGYRAIRESDIQKHVQMMIRSYAAAIVVLSFRVLHIVFFLWDVPYYTNYAISQWLGLSMNLLVAELIITFLFLKQKHKSIVS